MYSNILVVTDRSDVGESPIRRRIPWFRGFLDRLRSVMLEFLLPTVPTIEPKHDPAETIEVRTDNATEHAIDLALAHGARLHVLYFIDAVRYDTSFETAVAPLEEEGEESVDRIVATAEGAGLDVTSSIEIGRPVELILSYVADNEIDLIVMNTRGSADMPALVRGSVTAAVIRHADVPVYSVPLPESNTH